MKLDSGAAILGFKLRFFGNSNKKEINLAELIFKTCNWVILIRYVEVKAEYENQKRNIKLYTV